MMYSTLPRLSCRILRRCLTYAHSVHGKISLFTVKSCSSAQLQNRRMFHSEFANLDGCRLMTVADEHEISRHLCEMQTTDELMNFVSVVDSESWTPEMLSLLTKQLVTIYYQSLRAVHPWLQENIVSASKQIRLGDALILQDATAPVHGHPAYNTWMTIVEQNCCRYSPDQLADALLSTTNLFVDGRSSVVHKLVSETHKHLPDFSMTSLAALSDSLKALPGDDYILVRALLNRMQTLLTGVDAVNTTELIGITTVLANMKKFLSADLRRQLVTWLLQMIKKNKEALLIPQSVPGFIRLGYIQAFSDEDSSRKLVDIAAETCQRFVDQFTVSTLAKMCVLLQNCTRHDRSRQYVFDNLESRALQLLSAENRLCDVIELMNSLMRNSSPEVILQFYNALHSRLISSDYVDVYSLSGIARILFRMQSISTDLLMLVQRFIADQVDNIVPHSHLFSWIEKFLGRHCFLDKDLERHFNDCLLSFAGKYVGLNKYATSVVSAYLLPVVNEGLPTPVFNHVMESATQWQKGALYKHTLRLSSVRASTSSSHQLKQLNSVLYQTLCKQLDLVESLDGLHLVAQSLRRHGCEQHPVVTDRLMNSYTQYSPTLSDDASAFRIVTLFHRLRYHLPSVYDDLVRYVVNTDSSNETLVYIRCIIIRINFN